MNRKIIRSLVKSHKHCFPHHLKRRKSYNLCEIWSLKQSSCFSINSENITHNRTINYNIKFLFFFFPCTFPSKTFFFNFASFVNLSMSSDQRLNKSQSIKSGRKFIWRCWCFHRLWTIFILFFQIIVLKQKKRNSISIAIYA